MYRSIDIMGRSRTRLFLSYTTLVATVLVGCSTPAPKIQESKIPGLASKQREVVIRSIVDTEADVYVKSQGANWSVITGTGGLVGLAMEAAIVATEAAVRASIQEEREARAQRWEEQSGELSGGINFEGQFWNELESMLSSSSWVRATNIIRKTIPPSEESPGRLNGNELRLITNHSFSMDASVLIVTTHAWFFRHEDHAPVYTGVVTYYSDPLENHGEESIAAWMADDALRYRSALKSGILENMRMLDMELFNPLNRDEGEKYKHKFRSPLNGDRITCEGKLLAKESGRILMRETAGALFSFPTETR